MPLENRPITDHPVHIIYRLEGSLPGAVLIRLREQFAQAQSDFSVQLKELDAADTAGWAIIHQLLYKRLRIVQEEYDRHLDQVISGPAYLTTPEITQLILASWRDLEKLKGLIIDAISVMPNHVHIQVSTKNYGMVVESKKLMASHRRWTARLINHLRGTEGQKVWATPFFDRDIRWDAFGTVFWYILNNPVKAGLCADFRAWPGNYWRAELVD